jgi:ammonia channel protein AmtB
MTKSFLPDYKVDTSFLWEGWLCFSSKSIINILRVNDFYISIYTLVSLTSNSLTLFLTFDPSYQESQQVEYTI